jgi:hydrogenase expression/formation protein HypC
MCYAIPAKIIEIDGDSAVVDYGGVLKKVNLSLIDNPMAGDYVLIHAGFAIEKLAKKSAEESLKIIRNFMVESEKATDGYSD